MKLPIVVLPILSGVLSPIEASNGPKSFLHDFQVVVDSKSYRGGANVGFSPSKFKQPGIFTDFNVDEAKAHAKAHAKALVENSKALVDNVRPHAKALVENVRREATGMGEKAVTKAREVLKKYSRAEIGAYAALALSLTFAMKRECTVRATHASEHIAR